MDTLFIISAMSGAWCLIALLLSTLSDHVQPRIFVGIIFSIGIWEYSMSLGILGILMTIVALIVRVAKYFIEPKDFRRVTKIL
jgi:hypothetical protein